MNNANTKVDEYLTTLPDWQRKKLSEFRELLHKLEPDVQEDWKWGVPVFLVGGKLLCAMSTFTAHTKFNFFEGANLADKHRLFNSGLDSKKHRSINLQADETLDQKALAELIQEAIEHARQ